MPDTTPAVTPGVSTTEYTLAKIGNIVGILLIAAGGALEAMPSESRPAWVGIALVGLGAAKTYLTNAGYFKAREGVKKMALWAVAAAAAVAKAESTDPAVNVAVKADIAAKMP